MFIYGVTSLIYTQQKNISVVIVTTMEVSRVFFIALLQFYQVTGQQENTVIKDSKPNDDVFNSTVTASCSLANGVMNIHVFTQAPFYGRIMSLDSPTCTVFGAGNLDTSIDLNMNAKSEDANYCGVRFKSAKNLYYVGISVRVHKTLELAEDKQYVVSCSKDTVNRVNKPVSLSVNSVETRRSVSSAFYGSSYELNVRVNERNQGFRVRECIAFGNFSAESITLFDEFGCPESRIVSRWVYNDQTATATIYSMFRFENTKRLNIQCVVLICEQDCDDNAHECGVLPSPLINPKFSFLTSNGSGSGSVLVSTSVFVLDIGEASGSDGKDVVIFDRDACVGAVCPKWLLWILITLAVLFLLMLLVNLFLCSALTCTCTRTELIEKDPSVIVEDYDPYRTSWAGSQYGGSRYSLNPPNSNLGSKYH